jgi:CubicO group peptidase (beta-lactamase class C family)
MALVYCVAQIADAQNASLTSREIEQRIQHVTSGLIGGVVIKGDEHSTHTLADRMKEVNVPGVSIAVIHVGKIEWARGFGVSSVGGSPVTAETMFQAGSISKPLAAMAALRLAQQGKLSLDVDVNTLLTSWKLPSDPVAAGKPVTLRELLTHTAGITVHGFPGYASTAPVPTLVQVLNGEKPANTPAIRSEAAPGAKWNYSGGGYTIMQQTLIDVTKEPFPKLLHDTVLAPIGMTHSAYEQPLPKEFQPFAATPYHGDGKPVEGGAHTYPEMAAAGLWTTPTDLARYAIEVENSREGKANHVLSAEMTRQMLVPGMGKWGLAWR